MCSDRGGKMENNFEFHLKTKLFYGLDYLSKIGKILKEYSANRILVVYGQGSVIRSGLLEKVLGFIKDENIAYFCLGGVRPNPTIEKVKEGINMVKENQIDFILAIGGGSAMDTAKLISTGYYYNGDPFDISCHKLIVKKAMPLGVIPTIAASGSEMSNSCVIQDDNLGIKSGYASDYNRPLFAICVPELTYSVPTYQTAVGIVDILMHTLERYFSTTTSIYEVGDRFAIALMQGVIEAGEAVMKNPCDHDARQALMLYSSFSHNGLTSLAKKYILTVHQLEHVLSATYPSVAHGAGLAVLFPAWCKAYINYETQKLAVLGKQLFHLSFQTELENAKMCIVEFEKYFKKLGMPLKYKELGIDHPDIDLLVKRFSNNGTRVIDHHVQPLDQEMARKIYELAI